MKSTIKIFIKMAICAFLSITIVLLLYARHTLDHHKNGFNRNLAVRSISTERVFDIKYADFYIAGYTNHHLYLGNIHAPGQVLSLNLANLNDSQRINIEAPDTSLIAWKYSRVTVDSPNIYVSERILPSLFYTKLNNNILSTHLKTKDLHFDIVIPLSPDRFVVRSYDTSLHQNRLNLATLQNGLIQIEKNKNPILQKQNDGIFSTDGSLLYNRKLNMVIYTYYYRNEFICLDTNLNILYKGHTIDTVSKAEIQIANLSSGKSTLSTPPLIVNKKAATTDSWLIVNSGLLADNENTANFKMNSVFDLYSASSGKYQFSFYLPDQVGNKISSFCMIRTSLVALYQHYIYVYKFD